MLFFVLFVLFVCCKQRLVVSYFAWETDSQAIRHSVAREFVVMSLYILGNHCQLPARA